MYKALYGNAMLVSRGGGVLGYFLGGYVPHPVLKNNSPKIDTPF